MVFCFIAIQANESSNISCLIVFPLTSPEPIFAAGEFGFEKNIYHTPHELTMILGNNQTDTINTLLPIPVIVNVTDNIGESYIPARVHFTVTYGDGTLSETDVWTDINGNAQTFWTLGDLIGEQKIKAAPTHLQMLLQPIYKVHFESFILLLDKIDWPEHPESSIDEDGVIKSASRTHNHFIREATIHLDY